MDLGKFPLLTPLWVLYGVSQNKVYAFEGLYNKKYVADIQTKIVNLSAKG